MEIEKSVEIIKSLADTSRLQVVNSLLEKPQYVEELAQRLNLAVSTVSFHLKKLEAAGLVYKQKEQYYVVYYVCDDVFNLSLRQLISFNNIDSYLQQERIEKYKQKVLKAFVINKRVNKLPVQKKKRMIIIEEIFKKFNCEKTYTELEVNEIIKEVYDDYCTVRRIMVEEGMMVRSRQSYKPLKNSKAIK